MFGDKATHIAQQLSRVTPHKAMGNSTMICCPWHNDRTPSMRVYHRSGIAVCYGCKIGDRTFNDVADALHLEQYERDPLKPARTVFKQVEVDSDPLDEFDRSKLDDFRLTALPANKKWRDIPTNFLTKLGCQLATHKEYGGQFVYMPVLINGELRGYSRGRLRKVPGKPSYLNASGKWSLRSGLFPYDYAIKAMRKTRTRSMVLVEGQRDAMRLLMNGIPAMCFFGTQAWTDEKSMLLEAGGVCRAIPLLDGDQAGIESLPYIEESISKYMTCKPVRMWNVKGNPWPLYKAATTDEERARIKPTLWDPYNAPQWLIDKIKRTYFGG